MYKKLIKYGQNTALIIDDAILELLNIREDSIVHLTTDGKSLTITPTETAIDPKKIHMNAMEKYFAIKEAAESDPIKKQQKEEAEKWTQENRAMLTELYTKYANDFAKLMQNKEYWNELNELAERYPGDTISEEYTKESTDLMYKYAPNLENYYKELNEKVDEETRKKLNWMGNVFPK
jgi:antitoxin component of MazEF toxin-antitoxin module